jgi:RNA polymerase sigma-70 factor (ECF subfamily)
MRLAPVAAMPQIFRPVARAPGRDAALWEALRRDRSAGLGEIYDCYAPVVFGLARKILGQTEEAEDLTQEIFVSFVDRGDYDPARGSLAAYLVTLTRSRAIDRLRGRARRSKALERFRSDPREDDHVSALERISVMELAGEVDKALGALPEKQRQVLEMAYFRGMTQTEIASELATPLGTVKSWARLGLFGLRNALDRLPG